MKKETINRANKIIAIFMGLSYCEKYQYEGWYKNYEHNERICDLNGLTYHRDWNKLMPVIEKIQTLGFSFHLFSDKYFYPEKGIRATLNFNSENVNFQCEGKSNIEACYKTVILFIEKHNEANNIPNH